MIFNLGCILPALVVFAHLINALTISENTVYRDRDEVYEYNINVNQGVFFTLLDIGEISNPFDIQNKGELYIASGNGTPVYYSQPAGDFINSGLVSVDARKATGTGKIQILPFTFRNRGKLWIGTSDSAYYPKLELDTGNIFENYGQISLEQLRGAPGNVQFIERNFDMVNQGAICLRNFKVVQATNITGAGCFAIDQGGVLEIGKFLTADPKQYFVFTGTDSTLSFTGLSLSLSGTRAYSVAGFGSDMSIVADSQISSHTYLGDTLSLNFGSFQIDLKVGSGYNADGFQIANNGQTITYSGSAPEASHVCHCDPFPAVRLETEPVTSSSSSEAPSSSSEAPSSSSEPSSSSTEPSSLDAESSVTSESSETEESSSTTQESTETTSSEVSTSEPIESQSTSIDSSVVEETTASSLESSETSTTEALASDLSEIHSTSIVPSTVESQSSLTSSESSSESTAINSEASITSEVQSTDSIKPSSVISVSDSSSIVTSTSEVDSSTSSLESATTGHDTSPSSQHSEAQRSTIVSQSSEISSQYVNSTDHATASSILTTDSSATLSNLSHEDSKPTSGQDVSSLEKPSSQLSTPSSLETQTISRTITEWETYCPVCPEKKTTVSGWIYTVTKEGVKTVTTEICPPKATKDAQGPHTFTTVIGGKTRSVVLITTTTKGVETVYTSHFAEHKTEISQAAQVTSTLPGQSTSPVKAGTSLVPATTGVSQASTQSGATVSTYEGGAATQTFLYAWYIPLAVLAWL